MLDRLTTNTTPDVTGLYSTVVVRVTCNDEVLGSIPSGGINCYGFAIFFFLNLFKMRLFLSIWTIFF